MGSRQLSFAAVELHVAMDVSAPPFELNHAASATAWELLDAEVVGKSCKLQEFPECGAGDFREPTFEVLSDADGFIVAPLDAPRHRMFKGKPSMPACMPGLCTDSPTEATTLVVERVGPFMNLKPNCALPWTTTGT
jgi:hypothetical protein